MRVRLTQLDGALPNLALMKLAHWHRARGDTIVFSRASQPDLFESPYDLVYGSSIFEFSTDKQARFLQAFPDAILGGTGTKSTRTIEDIIGAEAYEHYDYSIYPEFTASIGYTQRGCRLKCSFCVVPGKEGRARTVNTIADIWRGHGHPKRLHLLDNDFFGQPEPEWRARIAEIREGGFKVCLNQGINVRLISPAAAEALASVEYRDDQFRERKLYTAWDNLGHANIFFKGMHMLRQAGIPAHHVRAYMLVGYDSGETWDGIWQRFNAMVEYGIEPYPMVFDCRKTDADRYRLLKRFQRWVVTGLYRATPFSEYDTSKHTNRGRPMQKPGYLPGLDPDLEPLRDQKATAA